MKGLLLIVAALLLGIWWWRKNYVPSPLEQHYADLENKAQNGVFAQIAQWVTRPVATMFAEGWGTTAIINPTNPSYNRPGKTRLNLRFVSPTSGGSGMIGRVVYPSVATGTSS